jgi:hypothetical protein
LTAFLIRAFTDSMAFVDGVRIRYNISGAHVRPVSSARN